MTMNGASKPDGQKLVMLVCEAVMAVFYLVFAALFLFPEWFHLQIVIQDGIRLTMGIVLTIYGIFRVYRVIKRW